jgi:DNA polymerase-1
MHHGKYDLNVLARRGLSVAGPLMDTMIAAQLLAPEGRAGLKELARARLGEEMTPIDDLIGDGRTMAQVPITGAAPYACADADLTLRLAAEFEPELRQRDQWGLFTEVEMPLVTVLADMERRGMAVDREHLAQMSQDLGARLEQLEQEIRELAGHEINLNSPKQLTALLFGELGLPILERTRSGAPSTKGEVLEKLRDEHDIVGCILEWRELTKIMGTYADALPELIHPETGRIHTSFNQGGARTGRMSASNPNLQNVPTRSEAGQRVRAAFVAPEGHVLLACDYSQIEVGGLAHLSKDPELCEAFHSGEDVHVTTAAAVFGAPLEEVTEEKRQLAKAVNFGLMYGMTARGLARRRGLSEGEAEAFMDAYFERFAGVQAFREELIRRAREHGGAETLLGRQRPLPAINSDNWGARSEAERQALNTPIQGSAADLIKLAMVRVHERLRAEGLQARMVLQVHDELLLEVPEDELKQVTALVAQEMEQVYPLDVPLTVDVKVGRNWLEMKEVERADPAG